MKRQCKNSYTMVWLLLGLQVLHLTSAFLLEPNQCLAPPPCTCSSRGVNCFYTYLPTIPTFKVPDSSYSIGSSFSIDLMGNHFTTVPANTFIIFSNTTNVYLNLNDNNISYIAPDAFKGLENSLWFLNLANNHLPSIPTAIGKLNALKTFWITNSPIKTLDPVMFAHLGHTLTEVGISLSRFNEWPQELHFLRKLKILSVYDAPFRHYNVHAFNGYESTLTSLELEGPNSEVIPSAVCHLTRLQSLTFRNDRLPLAPFFMSCILPSVTELELEGNKLAEFPDVFKNFPSLTKLSLDWNNIETIPSDVFSFSSNLTSLYVTRNKLHRIPYAINLFKSLSSLYLSNNSIHSVEDNDLTELYLLTRLDLSNNPISYISTGAFKHNPLIWDLNLKGTQLKHIPAAMSNLQHLYSLDLEDFTIECTCNLAYLRNWNVKNIRSWNPKCEYSTETVKEYISQSLQQCP